jgi:hypothetical protein
VPAYYCGVKKAVHVMFLLETLKVTSTVAGTWRG